MSAKALDNILGNKYLQGNLNEQYIYLNKITVCRCDVTKPTTIAHNKNNSIPKASIVVGRKP